MSDGPMTTGNDSVVEKTMAPWWKHLGVWVYAPVVLVVVSALTFVYLWQASLVAGQVVTMSEREAELHNVKQAISEIRLKIADNEGLERLQTEARQMGFREPESIEYVDVFLPPAEQNATMGGQGSSQAWSSPQGTRPGGGLISSAIQQFRDWTNPKEPGSR